MLIYILKHEGYSNKQVFQYVSVFVIIVLLIISQIQSQRKKNNGYLHQASICLIPPDLNYLHEVVVEKELADKIYFTTTTSCR